jgi:hypothetical protein
LGGGVKSGCSPICLYRPHCPQHLAPAGEDRDEQQDCSPDVNGMQQLVLTESEFSPEPEEAGDEQR